MADRKISVDREALAELRSRAQMSELEALQTAEVLEKLGEQLASARAESDQIRAQMTNELVTANETSARIQADLKTEVAAVTAKLEAAELDQQWAETEQERLRQQLAESEKRERDLRTNGAELTEALRRVQAQYWSASEKLGQLDEEIAGCESALAKEREQSASLRDQSASLREQLNRITGSKAWRLISAYRRVVKRALRRS